MSRQPVPELPRWDGPLSHPFYSKVVKRALDFLLALILLIPGCILMLPLAIWVKLDSPGPVFYRALRGGYHNKPFYIMKFRSMVVDADKTGGCTALNDSRVTRAGKVMRRLKLDELPQLFNILKGDMALVGTRPLSIEEAELLTNNTDGLRFKASAGLTGLWQTDDRKDDMPPSERIRLDNLYAEKESLSFDFKLILASFKKVIRGNNE